MAKIRTTEDTIYLVDFADRRTKGAKRIDAVESFVETSPGFYENTRDIMVRRVPGGGASLRIARGPRQVPEKDLINFVGTGSGFPKNTSKLKQIIEVCAQDEGTFFDDFLPAGSGFRSGTWVVSGRAKKALMEADPDGFEFWPIQTEILQDRQTRPGPEFWLCDLCRFVDCINPADRKDLLTLRYEGAVRFNRGAINKAPFFHESSTLSSWFFGTHAGRQMAESAGLTGLKFTPWGRQDG